MNRDIKAALVLACGIGCVVGCSGAQDKSKATYAAIVAGCKVSLDLDRDAGAAGAIDDEARACHETLKVWEKRP